MARKNRTPLPGSESFDSLGQVWHLAPLGPKITDAFSAWARLAARRNITRDKALYTSEEYEEELTLLRRQIDAGEYEWGPPPELQGMGMGPGCAALFRSDTGRRHLVRLLLVPAHGELSDEEIDALAADGGESLRLAFEAVFFSAYPWLRPKETAETEQESEPAPDAEAPAANPGGAPTTPSRAPISSDSSAATA